jgi:predicted TIM-barrel fold metal-dependent hydrolase
MKHYDCHAHAYDQIDAIKGARYVPSRLAPLDSWLKLSRENGCKGGVLVQVSFFGNDNSQICQALSKLSRDKFVGVAGTSLDVTADELDRLVEAGIRGVRWNLVSGCDIPDLSSNSALTFFERMRVANLHLELHLEGNKTAQILDRVTDQGIPIVLDHFGLPSNSDHRLDPLLQKIDCLSDRSNLFVKFSAHYRTPFDLLAHADRLEDLLSAEHIVWGSDWPHTRFEQVTNFKSVSVVRDENNFSAGRYALKRLYGLE